MAWHSYYREFREEKCKKCGSIDKLQCHHVDFDYNMYRYGDYEKIITLCSKCHHKLHNIINKCKKPEKIFIKLDLEKKLLIRISEDFINEKIIEEKRYALNIFTEQIIINNSLRQKYINLSNKLKKEEEELNEEKIIITEETINIS